ncbi:hypothetical protein GCM10007922_22470 [Shewanella decolorationis]|nr:hypothetical protein GCM10007922_22470 [Shewanella decolorationis]
MGFGARLGVSANAEFDAGVTDAKSGETANSEAMQTRQMVLTLGKDFRQLNILLSFELSRQLDRDQCRYCNKGRRNP